MYVHFIEGEVRSDDGRLKMSFKDILQFVTGTTRIPPLGFDKNLKLNFIMILCHQLVRVC